MDKLYKATVEGNVAMTPDEEAATRARWEKADKEPKVRAKTVDEVIAELQAAIDSLKAEIAVLKTKPS